MNASKTADSYSAKAEKYEKRWEGYLQSTHEKLLTNFTSHAGAHILDISSGTGLLAQKITERDLPFFRLVLNDISKGMQKKAVERFSHHPKVQLNSSPAFNLPFRTCEFDIVICLNAFHNYNHKDKCAEEMHRVLKPGGKIYLLDWNNEEWFKILNTLITWSVSEHIETYSGDSMDSLFQSFDLNTVYTEKWRYKYWNLILKIFERS